MRSMCVGVAETGHRGSGLCADGSNYEPSPVGEGGSRRLTDEVLLQHIAEITRISPCSHPYFHPNSNREVRCSPTWHSSESESALKRFEPVAVAML